MPKDEKIFLISFLLNQLKDEYDYEIKRKELLESKALGYYTIIGIVLAGFIAIQIAIFQCTELAKSIIYLNVSIFVIMSLCYLIFIILHFFSYKVRKLNVYSILDDNWNKVIDIMKISVEDSADSDTLDGFVKKFRVEIKAIIKINKKRNERLVTIISVLHGISIISSVLLLIEIGLFIVQII